ncbi:uncharacterized protein V1516DRAFT_662239 [Lipomyces oligophaga]|uniref:uncharacterized protein n=1 Tax=Lipomyces oligophaga TaxID=45792 RepID=UPI0034CF6471
MRPNYSKFKLPPRQPWPIARPHGSTQPSQKPLRVLASILQPALSNRINLDRKQRTVLDVVDTENIRNSNEVIRRLKNEYTILYDLLSGSRGLFDSIFGRNTKLSHRDPVHNVIQSSSLQNLSQLKSTVDVVSFTSHQLKSDRSDPIQYCNELELLQKVHPLLTPHTGTVFFSWTYDPSISRLLFPAESMSSCKDFISDKPFPNQLIDKLLSDLPNHVESVKQSVTDLHSPSSNATTEGDIDIDLADEDFLDLLIRPAESPFTHIDAIEAKLRDFYKLGITSLELRRRLMNVLIFAYTEKLETNSRALSSTGDLRAPKFEQRKYQISDIQLQVGLELNKSLTNDLGIFPNLPSQSFTTGISPSAPSFLELATKYRLPAQKAIVQTVHTIRKRDLLDIWYLSPTYRHLSQQQFQMIRNRLSPVVKSEHSDTISFILESCIYSLTKL